MKNLGSPVLTVALGGLIFAFALAGAVCVALGEGIGRVVERARGQTP